MKAQLGVVLLKPWPGTRVLQHDGVTGKRDCTFHNNYVGMGEKKSTSFSKHCGEVSQRSRRSKSVQTRSEREKRRTYDQRIREVEHGSFAPLVFSATGGMGPSTTIVYKRLATLLAYKRGQSYSMVIKWLRCRLSFSLLRSSIAAIRGTRQLRFNGQSTQQIDLAIAEGHIPST